jgi:hypothetical protein
LLKGGVFAFESWHGAFAASSGAPILSVVLRYVYMRKSFIRRQGGKNVAEVYTSWDNLDGGGSIMALDRMA